MNEHAPIPPSASAIRCVKCDYDLSGTAVGSVCPECGTPVAETFAMRRQPRTSGFAVASLVLGLLALPFFCFTVLGPLALVFGFVARREISRGGYSEASSGMAMAGLVLGALTTVLSILWISMTLLGI